MREARSVDSPGGFAPASDLVHILVTPSPELGFRPPADSSRLRCPLGRNFRLEVLQANAKEVLVRCVLDGSRQCSRALLFAGGFFCRELWNQDPSIV